MFFVFVLRLDLALQPRLTLNLWRISCLSFPNARLSGMCIVLNECFLTCPRRGMEKGWSMGTNLQLDINKFWRWGHSSGVDHLPSMHIGLEFDQFPTLQTKTANQTSKKKIVPQSFFKKMILFKTGRVQSQVFRLLGRGLMDHGTLASSSFFVL